MFCCKLHESGEDLILAVCDKELIGKTISHHDGVEVHVSPAFYGSQECGSAEVVKLAKKATIINAIGGGIIELLIKEKIVDKGSVIKIGKIPHAQVISI